MDQVSLITIAATMKYMSWCWHQQQQLDTIVGFFIILHKVTCMYMWTKLFYPSALPYLICQFLIHLSITKRNVQWHQCRSLVYTDIFFIGQHISQLCQFCSRKHKLIIWLFSSNYLFLFASISSLFLFFNVLCDVSLKFKCSNSHHSFRFVAFLVTWELIIRIFLVGCFPKLQGIYRELCFHYGILSHV